MRILQKDEVENNEHNLYSVVPPQIADHPLFNSGHTVGIMTAESPRFPTQPGGNEALSTDLHGLGLHHEPTHGSYGAPENSFIVHNPTREHMYMLGRKYGQKAVVYSQDGKHELLYTNGPNAGKHHESKPSMHYSQTQPKDFYTQGICHPPLRRRPARQPGEGDRAAGASHRAAADDADGARSDAEVRDRPDRRPQPGSGEGPEIAFCSVRALNLSDTNGRPTWPSQIPSFLRPYRSSLPT
jgi:hypothetical protein